MKKIILMMVMILLICVINVSADTAIDIGVGGNHACAIKDDNTVACWGYNSNGQLGIGNTDDKHTPVNVENISNVIDIKGGESHTCALKDDGTVSCWGWNAYGQLGDNTTIIKYTPINVTGLSGVIGIAVGRVHSCALRDNGTVSCWGYNAQGQIGDGTADIDRLLPVNVIGLSNIVSVASGYYHTCALRDDGTVSCWGGNGYGQLGNGSDVNEIYTPVSVSGLSPG